MAKEACFGPPEPLYIYQDDFFEDSAPIISHATMPPSSKPHRRPLQNTNGNVVLNPPAAIGAKNSPFKSDLQADSPLLPSSAPGHRLDMIPMMPPNHLSQPTDNPEKKRPVLSKFRTGGQKAGPEGGMPQYHSKENMHHMLYPAPPAMAFYPQPEDAMGQTSGKRFLLEAAPIKELRPAKKMRLGEQVLPAPDSFPMIVDDGTKPGHSYATLIGMAILRSPQRRLTLAQIYKWISDTYSFYNPNDAGWQNSIRHNLSLNKNFVKQERPKDDPGKGNYWAIELGAEHLFMKERSGRRTVITPDNASLMSSTRPESAHQHLPLMSELMMQHQVPMSQASLPTIPTCSLPPAPTSMPAEISSDATIPQSELAALEEGLGKRHSLETVHEVPELDIGSPSAAAMHSSPPISKHVDVDNEDTPPSMQRMHGSSVSKTHVHKRKHASMDDSGYISSLESSVMRPDKRAKLLTSDPDGPRIKRGGRAEDEIVRLRASSYDSPTKGRSFAYPPTSSPWRRNNEGGQMLPPLTPATKLKAPPKPPPSVSPNTNLRLHRESVQSMLDSPERRADFLLPRDASLFSLAPGLCLDDIFDGVPRHGDSHQEFDIFQDPFTPMANMSPAVALTGSPIKRSAKKTKIDRPHSFDGCNATSSVLATVPQLKASAPNSNAMLDTPSKVFDGLPSSPSKVFAQTPSKMFYENDENLAPWFALDEFCRDNLVEDHDFAGFDMLGNFEKIGSVTSTQMPRATRPSQKPPLSRSYTSTF